MEISTLVIGIVIGLVIGFAVAWMWSSSLAKAKGKDVTSTEAELKALLAAQANNHLRDSTESIERMSEELNALKASMKQFEQSLSTPLDDDSNAKFFGEQTSLFLRNSAPQKTSSDIERNTSDQPRDFSSKSSGLFAGHPDFEKLSVEEKSNN